MVPCAILLLPILLLTLSGLEYLKIAGQSLRMNFSRHQRLLDSAIGFALVGAIPEFTTTGQRLHFCEAVEYLLLSYLPKTEIPNSRGINEVIV